MAWWETPVEYTESPVDTLCYDADNMPDDLALQEDLADDFHAYMDWVDVNAAFDPNALRFDAPSWPDTTDDWRKINIRPKL